MLGNVEYEVMVDKAREGISFVYIPGHQGHAGNGDELVVKEAAVEEVTAEATPTEAPGAAAAAVAAMCVPVTGSAQPDAAMSSPPR